jgi:hypothetical protein
VIRRQQDDLCQVSLFLPGQSVTLAPIGHLQVPLNGLRRLGPSLLVLLSQSSLGWKLRNLVCCNPLAVVVHLPDLGPGDSVVWIQFESLMQESLTVGVRTVDFAVQRLLNQFISHAVFFGLCGTDNR